MSTVASPRPSGGVTPTAPARLGFVTRIASVAALGGFMFGYDTAVINGAVTAIRDHFGVGTAATGLTVAAALLGSAVGAWIAGSLADRHGRTRVMQIAALLFAISAVGSAVPFAIWDLGAWRFVGGIAIGIASVIAPTYIAEVAPAAYRGRLASLQQLAIVLGIAISQLVDWGIAAAAGGASEKLGPLYAWQWMLAVAVVPAVLYGALSLRIPESPRHLVAVGRTAEARDVLARVEGGDVDARMAELEQSLRSEHRSSLKDLRGPRGGLLPVVWIGIALSVLQQFVGINVIFYYSSMLWQSVGIEESNSLLISFSTSIINIVGTFVAIALVDRIGRKPLLLIGSIGMTVALGLAAWSFSAATIVNGDPSLPELQGAVALVAANAFVLFFAFSWGPGVWVLLGEIFPNRVRAAALAVAAAAQWIANWVITTAFPSMADWSLSGSYLVFTLFAGLSIIFVARFVTETKGRTLESMEG
ncbi:sugar porter family MFS transporter [Allostreptomyces psammosilenae]|uniref:SP family sugar:H+ symporter-like MFS transporter n=1 Tax=Allostreptomyces psammosilenae TaxID=1892865 RepID=A0A853ADB5_9ACTN|nr:sugar porter family MFS transporter [Allostreptomyces psammosilenae]NYI08322.1 SP family sugar:H+ symporter-like MFS transporter [Allostreptomyces psammosilenae]